MKKFKKRIPFFIKSNVVNESELNKVKTETLEFLSSTLKKTLGPYGKTTIIQDRMLNHKITKDGYTVLNNIFIENEESRTILDLVKKISRNLVRKVGDGSTSSIIIANSLYKNLNKLYKRYHISPKDLIACLDALSNIISSEVKQLAIPVDRQMQVLTKIATVSTNNDYNYGLLIKTIFQQIGKFGFISLEKSKSEKTYYEITKGFELNRGMLLTAMETDPNRKTCEILDPLILMCDDNLTESDLPVIAELASKYCGSEGKPMAFIAKGFDNGFQTFLHLNITKNKIPFFAVEMAVENDNLDKFKDLAINIGCKPYYKKSQNMTPDYLQNYQPDDFGRCEKIISSETKTQIIGGEGNEEEINNLISSLEEKIDNLIKSETYTNNDYPIFELRKRIASLKNSTAKLYIGGATEDSKETDKFLLEDAISACKSALENGYIFGGNLVIPYVLTNKVRRKNISNNLKLDYLRNNKIEVKNQTKFVDDLLDMIKDSFLDSFICVLDNTFDNKPKSKKIANHCLQESKIYNIKKEEFEDFKNTNIVNSVETDIEILKSAISIIGLITTSNQFIKMNTITKY